MNWKWCVLTSLSLSWYRGTYQKQSRHHPDTIQTPSRHHQTPYRYPKLDCRMGVGWIEKGAGQVVSTEVWRIDLYRRVSFWRIDCRHKDSPRLSLSIQPRDQVSQAGQRICWFSGDDDSGGSSDLGGGGLLVICCCWHGKTADVSRYLHYSFQPVAIMMVLFWQ